MGGGKSEGIKQKTKNKKTLIDNSMVIIRMKWGVEGGRRGYKGNKW